MQCFIWNELAPADQRQVLQRPTSATSQVVLEQVAKIIAQVEERRDAAIQELTLELDGVALDAIRVSAAEFAAAQTQVSPETQATIARAAAQVRRFHEAQRPVNVSLEVSPGVRCEKRYLPIDVVGLYVPGGTAPLISTVIMLGVPAAVAGCRRNILVTPPQKDGSVAEAILVAAQMCGIEEVYKIGGAQAIAALAFGTETIPKVDKIFGPGNQWVTAAKQLVSSNGSGVAIDMPAGPSEVMVVIDATSDPRFAAADLLSQAEHGIDSQVVLVSLCETQTAAVLEQLDRQVEVLPRKEVALAALESSLVIEASTTEDVSAIINSYAPEHLVLLNSDAQSLAATITNAGSVFIGPWSPESVGDYASGTNHVLPTGGYAKAYSSLGTESFMKAMTLQELSRAGLNDIGPVVERLATLEGLDAHKNAVRVRLEALGVPR